MPDIPLLTAYMATILTFIALIMAGRLNYQGGYRKKYSFLSMFPYEMNLGSQMRLSQYFKFILSLFVVSNVTFYIIAFYQYISLSYVLFLLVFLVASGFVVFSLFMADTRIYKLHLAFAIGLMALNVLDFAFLAFFAFKFPFFIRYADALKVISIILAVLCLGLFFIPKLKDWMRLEAKENEDHTVAMVRPRHFILAMMEWIGIFLQILLTTLIFIFLA